MYSVRVEAEFSAAHFLSRYRGKCERLHGHNYRVRLWARGEDLDEGGMLVDFALLKDALRGVRETLDHRCLNDNPAFDGGPSAERIARYVFEEAAKRLPPEAAGLLFAAEVYETPANMARYEPGRPAPSGP
ncbi:MAG: 6-carboxytetrahydropterin synthase QueD [Treponema sp.]|jgi:6-pyruvoyltetrahydropterin/6-carboxytetrahydropterin synthase|nr:6-carboxytetrahydropterin synthase QueD [Treponema sp.]